MKCKDCKHFMRMDYDITELETENKRLREALEEIFSEYQSLRDDRLSLIRVGNTAYEALEDTK